MKSEVREVLRAFFCGVLHNHSKHTLQLGNLLLREKITKTKLFCTLVFSLCRRHCTPHIFVRNYLCFICSLKKKSVRDDCVLLSFLYFWLNKTRVIMEESIKQIGERLKGLREVLNIPAQEVADLCGISLEHYQKIESGEADPSVYRLSKISKRYGIDLDVLLFGEEPRMSSYFITRAGQGQEIDRGNDYRYQSLAAGFRGRKIDPFVVTVDPLPDGRNHNKNTHDGQEFDFMIDGTLEITIDTKVLVLNAGDSIYFDSRHPHCMRALGGEPATFISIII